jgi:hypothetical protein
MMDAKKEEANKKYAEKGGVDGGVRVNVMDIAVNDDFDIDDI